MIGWNKAKREDHRRAYKRAGLKTRRYVTARRQWLLGGVFLAEARLPAGHGDFVPVDEDEFDVGFHVERIAVGDDDVRGFACVERAELIGNAPNLRGVEGDGFQGFIVGKVARVM